MHKECPGASYKIVFLTSKFPTRVSSLRTHLPFGLLKCGSQMRFFRLVRLQPELNETLLSAELGDVILEPFVLRLHKDSFLC